VGHTVEHGYGVFDELGKLEAGDTIEVDRLTFSVRSVDLLSKADFGRCAEALFDQSAPGRLVLVTCEGWDGESWQSNIVVLATPV
jgi:sortase (surface protein transpeptidase)